MKEERYQKEDVLKLLKDKKKKVISKSYDVLSKETGYSKRQLLRLVKEIEERDIETVIKHGNIGRQTFNRADNREIEFIKEFKKQYPKITIAQFKDIYHEDVIWNGDMKDVVKTNVLKERSYSFFQRLFKKQDWESTVKHKAKYRKDHFHPLRMPSERKGMLMQIDGTPYDWFQDGRMYTLHLAVDDSTSEVLSGWFSAHECQFGYCKILHLLLRQYGIPMSIYSDQHTIFKGKDGNLTQFAQMMDELGIEMIYANTPEVKGRIERYNGTCQRRLPNDIKRFKIEDYDELNLWFNNDYKRYLNEKFSRLPRDPNDAFIKIEESFDYNWLLSWRYKRKILKGNVFSIEGSLYLPYHKDSGEILLIKSGTEVKIRKSVFTLMVYLKWHQNKYPCHLLKTTSKKEDILIHNQKDLDWYLSRKK